MSKNPSTRQRALSPSGSVALPRVTPGRLVLALGLCLVAGAAARLSAQDLKGLPLHQVQSVGPGATRLALLITGDGGWAGIDRAIARTLADSGVSVIGLDAATYLGTRRTPEEVAADVGRILSHYLVAWHCERIVLIGYSRGANIAPFIVNRLPDSLRTRIDLVAMLGLELRAGFHVSLFDLFKSTSNPKDPPVEQEVRKLAEAGVPMLCIYGQDEVESFCRDAPAGLMTTIVKSGAHHFDGDHVALARDILAQLDRP